MPGSSARELLRNTVPNLIKAIVRFVSILWRLWPDKQQVPDNVTDISSLQTHCQGVKIIVTKFIKTEPQDKIQFWNDFIDILNNILDTLSKWQPALEEIRAIAPSYDFSPTTQGNGFRSFVTIADKAVLTAGKIIQHCPQRAVRYDQTLLDEMKEIHQLFLSLSKCFVWLIDLKLSSKDGCLHASNGITLEEIIEFIKEVDQKCFYGRFIANAFDNGIRRILKLISVCMVSYSELYYSSILSILRSPLYALRDSLRAQRHVHLVQHAGVDFIRAFWAHSESPICMLPMRLANPVEVSEEISFDDKLVVLNGVGIVPSYEGAPMVKGRLISKRVRQGMKKSTSKSRPKSQGLIIHVHGGGFVSQSSQSQEIFLRKWADMLDVPIFSIDYSLAPAAHFPRPLDEVFYGYCLALANASLLGSTGERIVMAADSAGANLTLGAMLKCIHYGIRLPDGLMLAYVPVLINLVPSPARLLGLMDPLLPFGTMMRCAKAYINGKGAKNCLHSCTAYVCAVCKELRPDPRLECIRLPFLESVPEDPLLSPYLADNCVLAQMPPLALCTSTFDPCLDDVIVFATKLQKLGVSISLDIVEGLPHGFLNFCGVNEKAAEAMRRCSNRISALLGLES